jgi:DNA-binding beta-propeller fold protein YncE
MPVLRPSGSDFTSFVKAAAQYVAPGRTAKVSKSGGVSVALPGLGAVVRTSQVGALASPTTSAVIINGVTPPAAVAAVAVAVIRVLLGTVTTLAGGGPAFADGTTEARFNDPRGVAVTSTGDIVVADTNNHSIRLVTPAGVVTTLAGNGTSDFVDGTGTAARFSYPNGVAVIPSTNTIVVADMGNNRIRLVTPAGVVTTLAGQTTPGFADGTGAAASFNQPRGVALLSDGKIVVADVSGNRIRIVDPTSGVVTTLAGQTTAGAADGTGAAASFSGPFGVAFIPSTNTIVVADQGNHRIRLVTYPGGVVTTLAGSSAGGTDGTGTAASFSSPAGVAIDSLGNIIVADTANYYIRRITYPGGVVTKLAGNGSNTFADGTGTAARVNAPRGVVLNPLTGAVVLADSGNNRIRVIV